MSWPPASTPSIRSGCEIGARAYRRRGQAGRPGSDDDYSVGKTCALQATALPSTAGRCLSITVLRWSFGTRPTTVSTTLPSLNSSRAGIPRIWNLKAGVLIVVNVQLADGDLPA